MTHNTLVIGAGGVASVMAHKVGQNNDILGNLHIATRTPTKADLIVDQVRARNNINDTSKSLSTSELDGKDTSALINLIREKQISIVLNASSTHTHLSVMEACLETGAHYLDTSVYEKEGMENEPAPWYENYEWKMKERFAEKGNTAVLSIGFDPGVVNAFCRKAQNDYFDLIDTIDIMDVNGGSHGRYFATNFNPEINLREIMEDVIYWENGEWKTIPPHSKSREYDFPVVGQHKVYSMGHDEIHSLFKNIPARRIEFWMGFGAHYLRVFEVLNNLGLLSSEAVEIEGVRMAPIKMVKAVLPDPATLAEGYTGEVCIGSLIKGQKDGVNRQMFLYSTLSHRQCWDDVGAQAISYTTGVPAVAAALEVAKGNWNVGRMVNVEELDPDPFLTTLEDLGIQWDIREEEVHGHDPYVQLRDELGVGIIDHGD